MRLKIVILFSLLLLALWSPAYAQEGEDPEPEPLMLSGDRSEYPLGLYLQLLEDPGGELTIEDVTSPEYDARFTLSQEEVPVFGFTDSAYWARLRLRNDNSTIARWLLELKYANMHFIDLYSPLAGGDGFEVKQTGSMRPPSSRDILHPRFIFNLDAPTGSEQTFYLRFENGVSMTLPLALWEPASFFADSLWEQILQGIFLGLVLGLIGYNLFLLISLRDVSYLYLTLLLSGIALFEISTTGLMDVYVAPNLYQLKQHISALYMVLIFPSLILFNDSYISGKTLLPKIHVLNIVLVGVWIVLGLSTFFLSFNTMSTLMASLAATTLVVVAVTVVLAWQKGFRAARFLLIAWLGLLAGLLVFVLLRLGFISSNVVTENLYRFAFAWMAICWSIALADRINLLKAEAESANRELRDSEQRLSHTLEAMPVGVVVYGTDQKPTFTNKRTSVILSNPDKGIKPDISKGRTLDEAADYFSFRVAGSDEAYPIEKFPVYRALQGEASSIDDVEADLVDRRVPLEIWASPVLDNAGNVESAVVAFQDITQRKQSEMAMRASEAHFRVIVENNFEGIIFMGRDRKIMYVSPSYTQLNGLSTEEMIEQSGVGFIHPDDQSYVAETFQKLLQQPGERISAEYRIRHQDGSWIWIETNALNLLDDPQVQAVVLNSRNISERKKTEAELANYRHHLEQLVLKRTEELNAINEQLSDEMAERAVLEGLLHKRIQWMSVLALARQRIKGSVDLPVVHEQLALDILQLLDAGSLFLVRWPKGREQVEFLCHPVHQGAEPDSEAIRTSFVEGSALRQVLEPGEIVVLSSDEVSKMPAPICDCVLGSGMQSLILAPLGAAKSSTGVLGLALSTPKQDISQAQRDLIITIALNMADLAKEARFLDQSRAMVASEERNRLARDLHDSVTQVLFSASLVAEVLPQIWQRDPDRALESLEDLRQLTRGALAEMRTMLLELRPAAVAKSPLPELLAQLTEASTSRVQLPFRLFIEKTPPLPRDAHFAVYRIAQEALNNVVKHALAGQVTLNFRTMPLTPQETAEKMVSVRLIVEDDGVGFAPQDKGVEHLGLGIMRERAADIEADLEIDSRIGQGTRVILNWCGSVEDGEKKS